MTLQTARKAKLYLKQKNACDSRIIDRGKHALYSLNILIRGTNSKSSSSIQTHRYVLCTKI